MSVSLATEARNRSNVPIFQWLQCYNWALRSWTTNRKDYTGRSILIRKLGAESKGQIIGKYSFILVNRIVQLWNQNALGTLSCRHSSFRKRIRRVINKAVEFIKKMRAKTCVSRLFASRPLTLSFACRFFYSEDGGYTFLRNLVSYKTHTAPHPRRRNSSVRFLFLTGSLIHSSNLKVEAIY
jgi:hypothetical protein